MRRLLGLLLLITSIPAFSNVVSTTFKESNLRDYYDCKRVEAHFERMSSAIGVKIDVSCDMEIKNLSHKIPFNNSLDVYNITASIDTSSISCNSGVYKSTSFYADTSFYDMSIRLAVKAGLEALGRGEHWSKHPEGNLVFNVPACN